MLLLNSLDTEWRHNVLRHVRHLWQPFEGIWLISKQNPQTQSTWSSSNTSFTRVTVFISVINLLVSYHFCFGLCHRSMSCSHYLIFSNQYSSMTLSPLVNHDAFLYKYLPIPTSFMLSTGFSHLNCLEHMVTWIHITIVSPDWNNISSRIPQRTWCLNQSNLFHLMYIGYALYMFSLSGTNPRQWDNKTL